MRNEYYKSMPLIKGRFINLRNKKEAELSRMFEEEYAYYNELQKSFNEMVLFKKNKETD